MAEEEGVEQMSQLSITQNSRGRNEDELFADDGFVMIHTLSRMTCPTMTGSNMVTRHILWAAIILIQDDPSM